jgi:hypothetical protein
MRRRNRPPKPALRSDPGDLSWQPFEMGGAFVPSHLIRSDDLQVFLRPNGFTVVHHARPVDDADVADVLRLLGLDPAQARLTYGRTPGQREYRLPEAQLAPILSVLSEARSTTSASSPGAIGCPGAGQDRHDD